MIYMLIKAYNAEKTLRRAVDSIIKQTYTEWACYVLDNGSTDRTGFIADGYSQRDSRIISYHIEENHPYFAPFEFPELPPFFIGDDDFFCTLDSDDEYSPKFLSEMLAFVQENSLELAVCGSEFISVANPRKQRGQRAVPQNLIITDPNSLSDNFATYHSFMRPRWGKLYKGSILKGLKNLRFEGAYGGDTFFVFESLRSASRIGILAKTLHKYYVSAESASYKFEDTRIFSDKFLYDQACEFLAIKCGYISPRNSEFLLCVYMNALKDTLHVLLPAQIGMRQKLGHLYEMMSCEHTKQLASLENFGEWFHKDAQWREQRREFFASVANWLLSLEEVPDEQAESFCDMGEFACAAAEHGEGWVFFNKLRIQVYLNQGRAEEARAKLNGLAEVLPADADLLAFRAQLRRDKALDALRSMVMKEKRDY